MLCIPNAIRQYTCLSVQLYQSYLKVMNDVNDVNDVNDMNDTSELDLTPGETVPSYFAFR